MNSTLVSTSKSSHGVAGTSLPVTPSGFPHNLADLQHEASEKFGLTPRQTLEIAMSLYERGLISYPRVEACELRLVQFSEVSLIVKGYRLASGRQEYDPDYRAPCWVENLQREHHGIVPTNVAAGSIFGVSLSEDETRIYGLVHARLLNLFLPAAFA